MSDDRSPKKQPLEQLKDRLKEAVQDLAETLEGLVRPQPELVPIPVRGNRARQRRR